jgi:peptide chain release factor 2
VVKHYIGNIETVSPILTNGSMRSIEQVTNEINDIETQMSNGDFWTDKEKANTVLQKYQELKKEIGLINNRFNGNAVITIYAGAGGDDAEDWTRILIDMYLAFLNKKSLAVVKLDEQITKNGYRSISYEVTGNRAYGILQNETGVHRLVRLSPFNSKHTRETSFALVDIIPLIEDNKLDEISPKDLEITFSKSGGPGGQNVNKRETAVRITHLPTGLNVCVSTERSQEMNRAKAMTMLINKLEILTEKTNTNSINELSLAGKIDNEWGNHIRTYVMHPYKQVKDLRSGIETSDIDGVLSGNLDLFIVERP